MVLVPGGVSIPVGEELLPDVLSAMWASGGVVSTSHDVATFYGAVLDDLLQPQSVEAMRPPDSNTYGLGIDGRDWTDVGTAWGHNGLSPGYSSSAGVTDAGWVAAVLTNHADITQGLVSGRRARDLVGDLLAHVSAE